MGVLLKSQDNDCRLSIIKDEIPSNVVREIRKLSDTSCSEIIRAQPRELLQSVKTQPHMYGTFIQL
jgi:hypothetical protein